MNRKKLVKILIILLIFVGIISLVVFLYNRNHKTPIIEKRVETYTEYYNSIVSNEDSYIVVGSNDHNLNKYDKASISKYDSNKNKLLEKVYNKGYNSTYYDVLNDGDNYVVVGSYESTKDELNKNVKTAFLVKYDKDFNILFDNDFSVIGDSSFNSIIKVDDGYIVCGKIKNKGVIIKYDFNGNEIFTNYSDNIYTDILYLNGYLYVCGNNTISCLDLLGNIINTVKYDNVTFTSIINFDSYIYLSGFLINEDNNNGIIVSYDKNLSKINEVIYDKYPDTIFNKIILDDNSIIVIGDTYYYDENRISDGIIGKYTLDLVEKSIVRYNGNRNINFNDVIKKDDKYLVIGNYNDNLNISSKFFIFSSSLKNLGV